MLRRALGPIISLALTGCAGTAVLIERTPTGGVMHLDGDHAEAMADARRQMSEHCQGAYRILGDAAPDEMRGRNVTDQLVAFACGVEPVPDGGDPPSPPAQPARPATPRR